MALAPLKWRKATLSAARSYRRSSGAFRLRQTLSIGAFSLPAPWLGASHVVGVYTIPVSGPFTLKYDKRLVLSNTYSLVLRAISGTTVTRAVVWRSPASIVPFPDYIGEAFPAGSVIEIWNAQGYNPATSAAITLELGLLELPDTCCDRTATSYTSVGCIIGSVTGGLTADLDTITADSESVTADEGISIDALFANCGPGSTTAPSPYEFSSTDSEFSDDEIPFDATP